MVLAAGAEVLVVGRGPVMLLAAKTAALKGFSTTCLIGTDLAMADRLLGDTTGLDLSLLPVAGESADASKIEQAVTGAKGLILAFDGEEVVTQKALDVFMPSSGQSLQHVSVLSRNLNGAGMGFFASASKAAANREVWAGGAALVEAYRDMEKRVAARAEEVGAQRTVIRAGTLKGGGCGDPTAGGDSALLTDALYTIGQQDVVNWRLLFDCDTLGVVMKRGDVMPGPGFTAALTATSPEAHDGDSGRGGVANALVEALRVEAAANADFGVGTAKARASPTPEEWATLFASA